MQSVFSTDSSNVYNAILDWLKPPARVLSFISRNLTKFGRKENLKHVAVFHVVLSYISIFDWGGFCMVDARDMSGDRYDEPERHMLTISQVNQNCCMILPQNNILPSIRANQRERLCGSYEEPKLSAIDAQAV